MISLGRRIIWVVLLFLPESGSFQRGIFRHLQPVDSTSALGGEANTWELWMVQLCGWESFLIPLWTPLTPLAPLHSSQVTAWHPCPGSELFLLHLGFKPSFSLPAVPLSICTPKPPRAFGDLTLSRAEFPWHPCNRTHKSPKCLCCPCSSQIIHPQSLPGRVKEF